MIKKIKKWFIVSVVFLLLDWVWLGLVAEGMYQKQLNFLWGDFRMGWGVLAQVVIATTLYLVAEKINQYESKSTVLYSTLVGIGIYATYDLTNLYLISQWPVGLSFIDILWGGFQGLVAGNLVTRIKLRSSTDLNIL